MAIGESPAIPETDLFLSYNHQDQEAVLAIRRLLELRGIHTFLDRDRLVAGLPWPQALERALTSARAVAVFLGPHDFGLWQKREMFFALDLQVQAERENRQFPVIPVLLKDAQPQPGFLFLNTWADFRNIADEAEALEALIRAIERDERGTRRAAPSVCPYLGLRAFREEDQAFYFGREAFIELLIEKIGHQPIVAVVGPSGSGKSSVVLAGLLPRLRRQRPPLPTWDAVSFTPGDSPWWRLAHALVPLLEPELSEVQRIEQAGNLAGALLERNGALAGTIARVIERSSGTDRLLLVVDQFEEMFTLAPGDEDHLKDEKAPKEAEERKQKRAWFLEDLVTSTKSATVTIVLTLRADYYSHALNASRELCDALNRGQVALGPMLPDELGQAVTGPAGRVGLEFEPGLVNRILKEVDEQPGSLPLLEYALTQLWDKRRDGVLTSEAYDAFGGVAGAIGDKADGVYNKFSGAEKNMCRALLGRLVHVSPTGTEGAEARQRATRQEIGAGGWQIALKLAAPEVRLLVIGRDLKAGQETAEVAHEALIRSWKKLRDWLREDRSFLLWRQQLEVFLSIWGTSGATGGEALLRGPALDEALKWRNSKDSDLSAREREFIAVSNDAGRRRVWTRRIAGAITIVALMAGLAWFGYAQTTRYQIDRVLADAPWKTVSGNQDAESRQAVVRYLGALAYSRSAEALRIAQELLSTAQSFQALYPRVAVLNSIAQAQATAGQFAEAAKTWDAASRTAREDQDQSFQAYTLGSIAQAQATAGQFAEAAKNWDAALRATQKFQTLGNQAIALRDIAEAQATAGQFAEALSTALKIRLSTEQEGALIFIAQAQATAGQFAEALGTARKVQFQFSIAQDAALSSIAQVQANAGQFAEALSAAQEIQEPNSRVATLTSIAQAQATAGEFEEAAKNWGAALSTAQEIPGPSFQDAALSPIARAQATAGQIPEALSTAQKIQNPNSRVAALGSIAQAQATAGQFEAALSTAQRIQFPGSQAAALGLIAQARATAGQFAEALSTAQKIQDEANRSDALASIAAVQAKAHHWKAARSTVVPCTARDQLKAYAAILTEYAKASNPKLEQQLKANKAAPRILPKKK